MRTRRTDKQISEWRHMIGRSNYIVFYKRRARLISYFGTCFTHYAVDSRGVYRVESRYYSRRQ